jgi:hypothetical protein
MKYWYWIVIKFLNLVLFIISPIINVLDRTWAKAYRLHYEYWDKMIDIHCPEE